MTFEDSAYEFAAAFHEVKPKGSTPTVKYVKKLQANGAPIVGKYRSYCIPFAGALLRKLGIQNGLVIWDRIWVVKNEWKWSCTCHEMSHALDARLGKKKNEALAEQVESAAWRAGPP